MRPPPSKACYSTRLWETGVFIMMEVKAGPGEKEVFRLGVETMATGPGSCRNQIKREGNMGNC